MLFPNSPILYFAPSHEHCPVCGAPLEVLKTVTTKPSTLHLGKFVAHETILYCDHCPNEPWFPSEELEALIPPHCSFGYDVMTYAGKGVFLRSKTAEEIVSELEQKKVELSGSEVRYLAAKFIVYLSIVHRECRVDMKLYMDRNGGYILHLDSTCDGRSPHLMSSIDEITGFVLHNAKLPSENANDIEPFLRNILDSYGEPLAIVCDMSSAILSALSTVFPEVPVFICHFHFLRDIGKDVLSAEYTTVRNRLRYHGISTKLYQQLGPLVPVLNKNAKQLEELHSRMETEDLSQWCMELPGDVVAPMLALWALAGKHQGIGCGFPFDRGLLSFYRRLKIAHRVVTKLLKRPPRQSASEKKHLETLASNLAPLMADNELANAAARVKERAIVFDKLRKAMRIAQKTGNQGLNDDGSNVDMSTIEASVKEFYNWLRQNESFEKVPEYQKMAEQITKYWHMLFADPITIETSHGTVTIQPQRTNNLLERFFRDLKRDHCRRTGTSSMSRQLTAMLADTPLIKNLENPEYQRILLKGKATLEERFAEIDAKTVRQELAKARESVDRIPAKARALAKKSQLPRILAKLIS